MCLTIPAKIIAIKDNIATIQDANSTRDIEVTLLKDVKVGDWILYINSLALKKISPNDAQEIIELLETKNKIDLTKVSEKFKNIIEASRKRELTKKRNYLFTSS